MSAIRIIFFKVLTWSNGTPLVGEGMLEVLATPKAMSGLLEVEYGPLFIYF
jgi:hypothetical protein